MDWSTVGLTDKQVTLKPERTKKNKRRHIDLEPNALAWIAAYRSMGGDTSGMVVPWNYTTTRRHRERNRQRAGLTHWTNSAMRHSYCSYWLAKHHDANKLVLMSGHDDAETMWTNYHRGTTEAEAERFWWIMPPVGLSVVPMVA